MSHYESAFNILIRGVRMQKIHVYALFSHLPACTFVSNNRRKAARAKDEEIMKMFENVKNLPELADSQNHTIPELSRRIIVCHSR